MRPVSLATWLLLFCDVGDDDNTELIRFGPRWYDTMAGSCTAGGWKFCTEKKHERLNYDIQYINFKRCKHLDILYPDMSLKIVYVIMIKVPFHTTND